VYVRCLLRAGAVQPAPRSGQLVGDDLSYRVAPHRIAPHRIASHRIVLYRIVLYRSVLHRVASRVTRALLTPGPQTCNVVVCQA
jgi:hypothetical protein